MKIVDEKFKWRKYVLQRYAKGGRGGWVPGEAGVPPRQRLVCCQPSCAADVCVFPLWINETRVTDREATCAGVWSSVVQCVLWPVCFIFVCLKTMTACVWRGDVSKRGRNECRRSRCCRGGREASGKRQRPCSFARCNILMHFTHASVVNQHNYFNDTYYFFPRT